MVTCEQVWWPQHLRSCLTVCRVHRLNVEPGQWGPRIWGPPGTRQPTGLANLLDWDPTTRLSPLPFQSELHGKVPMPLIHKQKSHEEVENFL